MNLRIDLKSALCGLAVGVLAMFVIGAADSSSNQVGRYQISVGQSSSIIVDTTTGKAWGWQPVETRQYKIDGNFWDAK